MHVALTQAQLGIWMGHQQTSDSSIYNCAEVTALTGPLCCRRFESALRETLLRTESLCQRFVEFEGEPRSVSSELCPGVFQYADLSQSVAPQADADARMQKLLSLALKIEEGQLCKHRLYRLSETQWLWFHLAHHIALDGYAFQLFSRAVAQHYVTGKAGRAFGALSTIVAQDEDYETSKQRQQDEAFWRNGPGWQSEAVRLQRYRRPDAALTLSAARPRRCTVDLNQDLYFAIKQQARTGGMSWVNLLMALVVGYVAKHSNRTQLSMGLPVMLRLGTAGLNVPNMAMNINRLPVSVPLDATPMDTAFHIEERLTLQRPHQRFRYEGLRENRQGKPSFGPVINVMPFGTLSRFGDCQAAPRSLSAGPVEDLSIAVYPHGRGLRCDVDLHPEVYSDAACRELVQDLRCWLRDRLVHCLQPWSSRQGEKATRTVPGFCAITEIEKRAALYPEAMALACDARSWTYRELLDDVRRFAQWLIAKGLNPGELVAFDVPRCPELIPYVLGALHCGCGYLVVSSEQPVKRRRRMLEQARARLVLDSLPTLPPQGSSAIRSARPEDPAYVVFTSGSSGEPKGVEIPRRALNHFVAVAGDCYDFQSSDRVLQFADLAFDASVEEIFVTLCAGGCLVYREVSMLESLEVFFEVCQQKQVSIVDLPTAFWNEICWAMSNGVARWPQCVRAVIIGGEAAGAKQVTAFHQYAPGVRLLNTYGPSEATVVATVAELQPAVTEAQSTKKRMIAIGSPLAGVRAELVNEAQQILREPEAQGELLLSGPTLSSGYLGREDLSAERFRPFVLDAHQPPVRCYCTGDRVLRNGKGQLVFLGRLDDEIKVSGHRICPAEVEEAIVRHPRVRACAVMVDRTDTQPRLRAFVEASVGFSQAELMKFLGQQLPAVMLPASVHFSQRLRRNCNGKLDRTDLLSSAQAYAPAEPRDTAAKETRQPPGEREGLVMDVWQQLLGGGVPELDSNFFEVGGSSLQVIQLVNRLGAGGVRLKVADVFTYPTPRGLARLAERAGGEASNETSEAPASSRWSEVAELPPSWFSTVESVDAGTESRSSQKVLLTGGTGFVGAHLLAALLKNPAVCVTCLVRADNDELARERLLATLAGYGLSSECEESRWVAQACELGQPGVEAMLLQRLSACDAIVHAAAVVSLTRDFASLERSNVVATRQLLQFAGVRGARFHLVSTLAVVPQAERPAPEQFFEAHAGLLDGYQQSKWHSEALCQQAASHGLPVSVYRLGRVSGSRQRPDINGDDLVWRVARASVRAGVWPQLNVSEPWLPVDDAAALIAKLSLGPCSTSGAKNSGSPGAKYYNFSHNGEVELGRVCRALNRVGYCLATVSTSQWVQRVRSGADVEDQATLAFFELNEKRDRSAGAAGGIVSERVQREAPSLGTLAIEDSLIEQYCRVARNSWGLVSDSE